MPDGAPGRRVAIVTGGNSGIGLATVVGLATRGDTVIIAARDPHRAEAAVTDVRNRTGAGERVTTLPLDLTSFASVRRFVEAFTRQHDRCDVFVANAGLMLHDRQLTEDGHEVQFQTNHLGHFLLVALLREHLITSAPARVIVVSSGAHKVGRRNLDFDDLDWDRRRYRGFGAYAATKLMNVLFARELARRLAGTGVTANALHPGFVRSNFALQGDYGRLGEILVPLAHPFAITPEKGAATSIYLATAREISRLSGSYFYRCRERPPSRAAQSTALAEKLWTVSEELTGAA